MALIDLERALVAVCFSAEPPAEALAALGGEAAWLVYREMVRDRIWRELRVALPRTCALLPAPLLERAFAWHLEHEPPRTRFFRELVPSFVHSALPLWDAEPVPRAVGDLARYELALWDVADLEAVPPEPVNEFAFDRVPVLSRALRCLPVQHAVHTPGLEPGEYFLCVQRAADGERPRTWTLTQATYALLQRLSREDEPVTESVKRAAAEQGGRVDAGYVDALCTTLAQFLELGILLGSR
jgi:hypothetical protein